MTTYSITIAEIAEFLRSFPLLCAPHIEDGKQETTITIRVPHSHEDLDQQAQYLNLLHTMRYLVDVAAVRAVAIRYDIPVASFEQFLPKYKD